jgi:hypothetical protein
MTDTALDVCGCGKLPLKYGPITLNFKPDEFAKFAHDVERLAAYLTGKLVTATNRATVTVLA